MPPSADQLTELAKSRDTARSAVRQTLYRQCNGASVARDDIEDLSSETIQDALIWLRAHATPQEIDVSHLHNTVRLIAKRRALNWYYRRHRRNALFDEFRTIIEGHLHQRWDDRETLSRLDDVFAFAREVLDAQDIEIIRLKYMEGREHREIAAALGITAASSRARLSRAIRKLHLSLTEPLADAAPAPATDLFATLAPSESDVAEDRVDVRAKAGDVLDAVIDSTAPGAPEGPSRPLRRHMTYGDGGAYRESRDVPPASAAEGPPVTRSLGALAVVRRAFARLARSILGRRRAEPTDLEGDEVVLEGLFVLYGKLSRESG